MTVFSKSLKLLPCLMLQSRRYSSYSYAEKGWVFCIIRRKKTAHVQNLRRHTSRMEIKFNWAYPLIKTANLIAKLRFQHQNCPYFCFYCPNNFHLQYNQLKKAYFHTFSCSLFFQIWLTVAEITNVLATLENSLPKLLINDHCPL